MFRFLFSFYVIIEVFYFVENVVCVGFIWGDSKNIGFRKDSENGVKIYWYIFLFIGFF